MKNSYDIRLYDETLITFELASDALGGYQAKITKRLESQKLFPLDLQLDEVGILKWLERRVIPKNRTFVEEILCTFGLSIGDTKGIIDVCKGLSLNDSYWIVPEGFEGKFADYNLFENRFSEILSLVAYTGVTQSDAAFSTSPELTTNGMLPKAWRFIESSLSGGDAGIYLYKGGTSGFANSGKEPYCEFYASQVAEAMGIDAVRYGLENWKGILASTCKLFTDIDTAFIPIGRIVKTGGISAVVKYYDELGTEFADAVRDMLVFDALTYNVDRHFGNFGLLQDNRSGEIKAPAPVFDNGGALFNYAMPDDYANLDEYAKTRLPAYRNTTFEGICQSFMTARQVEKLRKVLNFSFERHPKLNLPEEHLAAIEKHLRKRASQLIGLTKRSYTKSEENTIKDGGMTVNQSAPDYKKDRLYTFEDWQSWDEDFRSELHDGRLIALAQPTIKHQSLLGGLFNQLYNFLKGRQCRVYPAPFGVRLNKKENTVFEPDIVVVCDKTKLEDGKICNGAPDMIIEILSPSSLRYDRVYKFNKYLEAGVREYWIVDPEADIVQVNVLKDGVYVASMYDKQDNAPVTVLEGCTISLPEAFE